MTINVEQEDAISILGRLKILPKKAIINIKETEKGKLVSRTYQIKEILEKPYTKLVIRYLISKTDVIKDYSITLENDTDKVYLCKYSPNVINTLFNTIINLELTNWRRVSLGLQPLRTIEDFSSLIFEKNIYNKRMNTLLRKIYDKNSSFFTKTFNSFVNKNEIIPVNIWSEKILTI